MTRFLQVALIDVLFVLALGTANHVYKGEIHTAGIAAIAAVLAVFCVSAAYALRCAWRKLPADLDLPIQVCPMLSMLGTVAGFLVAFSGAEGDVQERVLGASTGLVSTFVGIACAIVLMAQARLLAPPKGCCR